MQVFGWSFNSHLAVGNPILPINPNFHSRFSPNYSSLPSPLYATSKMKIYGNFLLGCIRKKNDIMRI